MRIIDADALFDSLIFPNDQWKKTFKELLDDEPTVDPSKWFDGMTNGEVMQAVFPNISVYEHGSIYSVNNEYNFNSTWWNAPYKVERGEIR